MNPQEQNPTQFDATLHALSKLQAPNGMNDRLLQCLSAEILTTPVHSQKHRWHLALPRFASAMAVFALIFSCVAVYQWKSPQTPMSPPHHQSGMGAAGAVRAPAKPNVIKPTTAQAPGPTGRPMPRLGLHSGAHLPTKLIPVPKSTNQPSQP